MVPTLVTLKAVLLSSLVFGFEHHEWFAGVLAGVAQALPGLTRAAKLTRRAARVGFDWPDAAAVLDKLDEEVAELRAELPLKQVWTLVQENDSAD